MPICERVHRALAVDAVADNAGGPYASTTTVTHIGDSTVRILGSHTLTPTTDDSGNSIYVTRTGVYAASSTTAHLTMPVATTTSSMGLSAITKFVTSTVTKTVLDLGTTTVPITASVQSLNDGTVLKVAGFPQATIIPLNVDWEEVSRTASPKSQTLLHRLPVTSLLTSPSFTTARALHSQHCPVESITLPSPRSMATATASRSQPRRSTTEALSWSWTLWPSTGPTTLAPTLSHQPGLVRMGVTTPTTARSTDVCGSICGQSPSPLLSLQPSTVAMVCTTTTM